MTPKTLLWGKTPYFVQFVCSCFVFVSLIFWRKKDTYKKEEQQKFGTVISIQLFNAVKILHSEFLFLEILPWENSAPSLATIEWHHCRNSTGIWSFPRGLLYDRFPLREQQRILSEGSFLEWNALGMAVTIVISAEVHRKFNLAPRFVDVLVFLNWPPAISRPFKLDEYTHKNYTGIPRASQEFDRSFRSKFLRNLI